MRNKNTYIPVAVFHFRGGEIYFYRTKYDKGEGWVCQADFHMHDGPVIPLGPMSVEKLGAFATECADRIKNLESKDRSEKQVAASNKTWEYHLENLKNQFCLDESGFHQFFIDRDGNEIE